MFARIATPYLSALAFGATIAGWRLVRRPRREDAPTRDQNREYDAERMNRVYDAMLASTDGIVLLRALRNGEGEIVDFEVTDLNPTAARLLRSQRESLIGASVRETAPWIDEDHFERYRDVIALGTPIAGEERVHPRFMNASWIFHQAVPIADGLAITLRDLSDRKREERRLHRASITDELTGLHNRRGFLACAEQSLRISRRQETDAVLVYLDMDEFKALNDRHGHREGDRALAAVGRLLRRSVRDSDLVARLGGDEFTILAIDTDGSGARLIQRRIEEQLATLNASGTLKAPIGLTIGYTRVRASDGANVTELLSRADALLYSRKRRRKAAAAARAQAIAREGLEAVKAREAALARLAAEPFSAVPTVDGPSGALLNAMLTASAAHELREQRDAESNVVGRLL